MVDGYVFLNLLHAYMLSSIRTRSSYIPFRESKLTKLFQAFFCGKGRPSMIVNINQCASTYDETLHVMKFSAVAKQVSLSSKYRRIRRKGLGDVKH